MPLEVRYRKFVPYSLPVVLSQYWDYEHIEHVHPDTLGRYRLLESEGDRAVYEQIWPDGALQRLGLRGAATSIVEQTFRPPREIHFDFVAGRNRGVYVVTRLEEAPGGTLVDETYRIPYLPNWRLLAILALPSIRKRVDHIWDEDTDVEVCHGGWPGVPESAHDLVAGFDGSSGGSGLDDTGDWIEVAKLTDLVAGRPMRVEIPDADGETIEAVLVLTPQGPRALGHRCPHTGGPLSLGHCHDGAIVCPWHGAHFDLESGHPIEAPGVPTTSQTPLPVYRVRQNEDRIEVSNTKTRVGRPDILARARPLGDLPTA
jgi:3-phenylpropionate/trans-cinnamate dioxygenase ferredoxin subunit